MRKNLICLKQIPILLLILFSLATQLLAEPVKVGVILPLSGPFARYGQKIQLAVQNIVDDKIQYIFEDEGCDPKMAVNAHSKLTNINNIKYFIGPWCGSPQSAIAPLIKNNKQLAILGSSAPQEVSAKSDSSVFSVQHSIEAESLFLAEKLNSFNIKSVVIIFKENAFSRAHEAAFRQGYKGKILSTNAYISDNISELKSVALKVKQLNPDALYVPDAFPLMAGLVKELKLIGVKKHIYSVYSAQSEDVLQVLGENGEDMIYSYPDIEVEEAFNYFPTLAAKILSNAIISCNTEAQQDVTCVKEHILKKNKFNEHGILSGDFVLKTIKDGRFIKH